MSPSSRVCRVWCLFPTLLGTPVRRCTDEVLCVCLCPVSYFDGYGITYTLSKSWEGVSVLNLFTSSSDVGNWVIPEGGIQLQEEVGAGMRRTARNCVHRTDTPIKQRHQHVFQPAPRCSRVLHHVVVVLCVSRPVRSGDREELGHHHVQPDVQQPVPAVRQQHSGVVVQLRVHGCVQCAVLLPGLCGEQRLVQRQPHTAHSDADSARSGQRRQLAIHHLRSAARLD